MPKRLSRTVRLTAAGSLALLLATAGLVAGGSPALAAGGSTLLNETFTGSSVPDPLAIGLQNACLTGAAAAPPGGSSNLGPCAFTSGTPNPGTTPGWLQLTDTTAGQGIGGMVYNRAIPSAGGLQIEFDQAQFAGNVGADGIGFFLTDGSRVLTQTGQAGGSLGYSQRGGNPGVAGGYLGVGLDSFGNFAPDSAGAGTGCATPSPFPGRIANTVTLRGPGDGTQGYCWLATTATPPSGASTLPGSLRVQSPASADAAARNVRITVSPGTFPTVTVELDFTGTRTAYQTVLSYTMTDPAPPTYKFGFSASTGTFTDVHLVRNVAIQSIDPLGAVNLVKQVDRTNPQPPSYAIGETVPYQFVVTNTGVESLHGIVVTDPHIAAISCPSTTLGPAGSATGSMVCTGSYTITGADAQSTSFTNTASVTATNDDGTDVTDTASATVPVTVAHGGLSLVKSGVLNDTNGNGLADIGETIDYSFALRNIGNTVLTGVGVDDPRAGAVTCPSTTLALGASMTCTADAPYTVTEADILAGGVANTATGQATPPPGVPPIDPPTDTITTPTPVPAGGLSMTKRAHLNDTNANGLADIGETIDYSFELFNTGTVTLSDLAVDDPKAGAVTCPAPTLAPLATMVCTADAPYTVTEADELAGGVQNFASATATTPPGVPAITPPTDTVIVPTPIPGAGLSLTKRATLNDTNGNGLADPGETIQYFFDLFNTGNVTLDTVGVDDPRVGAVTCPSTTLAIGATMTCSADALYTVTEADLVANGVVNTATGTASPPPNVDLIPPTDTITTPTPAAAGGLSIVKAAQLNDTNGNDLADLGETIDYSFAVQNIGTVTLTGVGVSDPKAGAVTCPSTTLAPFASMTCTADAPYAVTEADILAGAAVNTATANGTPPDGVAPIDPPSDTATTPAAFPQPGMTLVKRAHLNDANGNGKADVGETIDYTFALTNTGNVTLTGVGVTDRKAGTVTCPSTTLAPAATMTCAAALYTVTAADVATADIVNVATANGTPPEGVTPLLPPTDTVSTPANAVLPPPAPPVPGPQVETGGRLAEPSGAVWFFAAVAALGALGVGTVFWRRRRA